MPPKAINCVIGKNGVRYYYKNKIRIEKPRDADTKDYGCKEKTLTKKIPTKSTRVSPKLKTEETKSLKEVDRNISELVAKHKEFVETTRKLQEENLILKKENEMKIVMLDEKIQKLKQKRAKEREEDTVKIREATAAIEELKRVQKDLREDRLRIANNLNVLAQEKSGLEVVYENLKAQKQLLESETETLKNKLSASVEALKQNSDVLAQKEDILDSLKRELADIRTASLDKDTIIGKLERGLELEVKEKVNLRKLLEEEKYKISLSELNLRKELSSAATECVRLQDSIKFELEGVKRDSLSKDAEIIHLKEYQKEVEKQLSDERQRNLDMLAKGVSPEEIESVKKSLTSLETKNKVLLDEIAKLKSVSDQYSRDKSKYAGIERENNALTDLVKKRDESIESLRADLSEKEENLVGVEERLIEVTEEKKRLEKLQRTKENERKIAAMESQIQELSQYKTEYEILKERTDKLMEAEGKGGFFSSITHTLKNMELQQDLQDKQEELNAAKTHLESVTSKLETATNKLSELDTLIETFGGDEIQREQDEATLSYLERMLTEKNRIIDELERSISSHPTTSINSELKRILEAKEKILEAKDTTINLQASNISEKDKHIKELGIYKTKWDQSQAEGSWIKPWTWSWKKKSSYVDPGRLRTFQEALDAYQGAMTTGVRMEAERETLKNELKRSKDRVAELEKGMNEIRVVQSDVVVSVQKSAEIFQRIVAASYDSYYDIIRSDDPSESYSEKEEKTHEKNKDKFLTNSVKLSKSKESEGMMESVEKVIKELVKSVEARNKMIIETREKLDESEKTSEQSREYVATLNDQLRAFGIQGEGFRQYCKTHEKQCSAISIIDYNEYVNYVTAVLYYNALGEKHPIHPYVSLGRLPSSSKSWGFFGKNVLYRMKDDELALAEGEWRAAAKILIPRMLSDQPEGYERLVKDPFIPTEERQEIEKITKQFPEASGLKKQEIKNFTGISQSDLDKIEAHLRKIGYIGILTPELKKELLNTKKGKRDVLLPKHILNYTDRNNIFTKFISRVVSIKPLESKSQEERQSGETEEIPKEVLPKKWEEKQKKWEEKQKKRGEPEKEYKKKWDEPTKEEKQKKRDEPEKGPKKKWEKSTKKEWTASSPPRFAGWNKPPREETKEIKGKRERKEPKYEPASGAASPTKEEPILSEVEYDEPPNKRVNNENTLKSIAEDLKEHNFQESEVSIFKEYLVDKKLFDILGYALNPDLFEGEDLQGEPVEFLKVLCYTLLIHLIKDHEEDIKIDVKTMDKLGDIVYNNYNLGWAGIQEAMTKSDVIWISTYAFVLDKQIERDVVMDYSITPKGKRELWKLIFGPSEEG